MQEITSLTLFHARRPAARRLRAVLALLVGVYGTAACAEAGPTAPEEPASAEVQAQELAVLVNQHRQEIGCGSLALHAGTTTVSQGHSEDMVARNFFAHVNPDGKTPFDRLREAGISYSRAGENLAVGHPTAQAVFTAWLNSPGHRKNIENCAYTHHGLGWHENRWTHMFVHPG